MHMKFLEIEGYVEFKDVLFKYEDEDREILKNVSF